MYRKFAILGIIGAVSVTAATIGLAAPTAQAANPNLSVASSGATVKIRESARNFSASAPGLGSAAAALDSYAEFHAASQSPAERAAMLRLRPLSGPKGQETIIGPDTRVRVNPTTSFPARATVLITFSAGRCTGWLINHNTVVTAGHCVHPGGGGGFYSRASYRVYPGYNGTGGGPTAPAPRRRSTAWWAGRRAVSTTTTTARSS